MKHTRLRRRAFFAFLVLVWAAGLVVTLAWFRLAGSADRPDNPVAVTGLVDTVYVDLDTLGIPTIHAGTELDAWRSLGYVHAADRFWQMDYFRRIGTGRLAEVFGERALGADRFVRTLGLPRIARRALDRVSDDDRAVLEAYAAGVNAWLARVDRLPPEFQILRFEPEPWTPDASLAIGLVMNLDLSSWRRDLARYWAASHLPPEKLPYLRPRYPEWGPRTLDGRVVPPTPPGATSGDADAVAETTPAPASSKSVTPTGGAEAWDPVRLLSAASIRAASNAWAVGPSRTLDGGSILASDMHLALRAPAIWYVAAIHAVADDFRVAGLTLPGTPGVIVGFNRDIAWGVTNAMVDDMDFVVETLDEDGRRYRRGDGWAELEARPETIRVNGGPTRIDTVRSTVRGPLITDVLTDLEGALSVMFVPAHVAPGLEGLLGINRAESIDDFHAAATRFTQPHLNFLAAGADGRIGYHLAGSIPLRSWDGEVPVSAAVAGPGWPGFWSPGLHPAGTDSEQDFFVNANNLQAAGLDGAIGADWPAPFPALRLTQALLVRRDWTVESTARLQQDVRSLLAGRGLGRAVAAARRLGEDAVADTLAGWDRDVDVDSRGAPLFYAWFYGLRALVAGDEWAPAPSRATFPTLAMLDVLEEGDANPWVDDVSTPDHRETLAELEERAMARAIEWVDGRRWGDLHEERHVHPLGTQRWLDRLFGFNVGPYPSPGGPNTVRPDSPGMWSRLDPAGPRPPWISEYGPSERLVVEMGSDGPRAGLVIPTGQSGNPFSPHYRDMNEAWREGRLVPLGLEERKPDEVGETVVLIPAES